jgi:hypothetical protein
MPLVEGIFPFLVEHNVPGCNFPGMQEEGPQLFLYRPGFSYGRLLLPWWPLP